MGSGGDHDRAVGRLILIHDWDTIGTTRRIPSNGLNRYGRGGPCKAQDKITLPTRHTGGPCSINSN